jgi:hypothetical protein
VRLVLHVSFFRGIKPPVYAGSAIRIRMRAVKPFELTVTFGVATAQERSANELVKALQSGGYVLVMRHASSPREAPSKEVANADNTKLERQLDAKARR